MILRTARHTRELKPVIDFYVKVIGLAVTGSFAAHNGYDGVFLGLPGEHWHLEFTISEEAPEHKPDDDDLLVFYAATYEQYHELLERARLLNVPEVIAKNPYWREGATTLLDPDGYRVVVTYQKGQL